MHWSPNTGSSFCCQSCFCALCFLWEQNAGRVSSVLALLFNPASPTRNPQGLSSFTIYLHRSAAAFCFLCCFICGFPLCCVLDVSVFWNFVSEICRKFWSFVQLPALQPPCAFSSSPLHMAQIRTSILLPKPCSLVLTDVALQTAQPQLPVHLYPQHLCFPLCWLRLCFCGPKTPSSSPELLVEQMVPDVGTSQVLLASPLVAWPTTPTAVDSFCNLSCKMRFPNWVSCLNQDAYRWVWGVSLMFTWVLGALCLLLSCLPKIRWAQKLRRRGKEGNSSPLQ